MKKAALPALKRIPVWTHCYRPFIMGGDVNQPISCVVDAEGPFSLGQSYKGYLIRKPDGGTVVAEYATGALIGPTLEAVREDIRTADPQVMREQIVEAIGFGRKAKAVLPDEFWKYVP